MEVLGRILLAFNEISSNVKCNGDFFDLPTYWHIDNVPYLIKKNKKSISVEQNKDFPKKILIYDGTSKEDIINLIYKNFIY